MNDKASRGAPRSRRRTRTISRYCGPRPSRWHRFGSPSAPAPFGSRPARPPGLTIARSAGAVREKRDATDRLPRLPAPTLLSVVRSGDQVCVEDLPHPVGPMQNCPGSTTKSTSCSAVNAVPGRRNEPLRDANTFNARGPARESCATHAGSRNLSGFLHSSQPS